MKFFVEIVNRYGWFYPAAYAAEFEMRLARNGNYRGWITREQIDALEKAEIEYRILDD